MSRCRLLRAPAGSRPFPTLYLRICLCMLGPLPRQLPWCIYPFLPTRQRPSRHYDPLGASQNAHAMATSAWLPFSRLLAIRSPSGLQICSPPRLLLPQYLSAPGSRGFYFPAYLGLLPRRAGDMLAVRYRATDGRETFTLLDSQPCRPLP